MRGQTAHRRQAGHLTMVVFALCHNEGRWAYLFHLNIIKKLNLYYSFYNGLAVDRQSISYYSLDWSILWNY